MDAHQTFVDSSTRCFMAKLFATRAIRHLEKLAAAYGWTPEQLEENKRRFICPADMIPEWRSVYEK